MNLRQGTLLQGGKYRIERELGHGGFGVTYSAVQVGLNRRVAIKEFFMSEYCNRDAETSHVTVPSEGSRELVERFRSKFIKEAQNIASLKHPHIISIHDVFEDNGTAYYVMEYLDHGALADLVKRQGRLCEADALRYTRQIADALRYIHARKMNHLDVKPGNILIDETDGAVLIDFGLSKRYDDEGNQTSTTPVGISHGYAPLEQYKKGGVGTFSPSTDIYSLGATLYKLITGTTPPDANDILIDGLPAHPGLMSTPVYDAIKQAMQPNKNYRPQSVEAFLALLDAIGSATVEEQEEEATQLDDSLRASLVTPPSPGDTPSINRGGVGSASSRLEENHRQDKGSPKGGAKQTPFSFKKLLWPLLACVVAVVAFFGVRAYSEHRAEVARLAEEAEEIRLSLLPTGQISGYDYVDLGLSVKWATCNVGASSPSDYGNYYAWGETRTKSDYDSSNSVTYDLSVAELKSCGIIGTDGNLTPACDAARVNWGGTWRMPTLDEMKELTEKCTWTSQGGHNGYRVTGPNGKSIFLPAAGYRSDTSLIDAGFSGYYWSATPHSNCGDVCYLEFNLVCYYWDGNNRGYGQAVRPVSD